MPQDPHDPSRTQGRPASKGWIAALPIIVFLLVFVTIAFGMAAFAYQNGAPWIFVLGAGGIGVVGLCFGATGAYAAYVGRRTSAPTPPSEHDFDPPAPTRATTPAAAARACAYCGRMVPADQFACPGCGSTLER